MTVTWYALRWGILERDNFTCQYCGQHAPNVVLHIDHKIAKTNGGNDEPDNLITSCAACNVGKNTKGLTVAIRNKSGKPRKTPTMVEAIIAYLEEHKQATGTELAKQLGYSRVNIAGALSKSGLFYKLSKKQGCNVYYCLK